MLQTPENLPAMIAGFAILGTVIGFMVRGWSIISSFFKSCLHAFFIHAHLEDETTARAVLAHLVNRYRRVKSGDRMYGAKHESLKDGKYGHISFEVFGTRSMLFRAGWTPFWFSVQQDSDTKKEGNSGGVIYWGSRPPPKFKACIIFLRFTLDVEKVVADAVRERNQLYWNFEDPEQKRFFVKKIPDANESGERSYSVGSGLAWYHEGIYRLLDRRPEELGRPAMSKTGSACDDLYFPKGVKKLVEEARQWHGLKDWYANRGIPWKRGWCLYGPPGTGKTALVRAIAQDLDMPLFVFSLGHMLDKDLERSWQEMQAQAPCIALFEDFDTVFHGRENIYGRPSLSQQISAVNTQQPTQPDTTPLHCGQLSFGCLLNCIDGVDKAGGIFTIITTNHIEHLDPALGQPRRNEDGSIDFISTRPGRIDKAIELGYMDNADKLRLAKRIFFDNEEGFRIMARRIEQDADKRETPAQFQEECAQLALAMLWSEEKLPSEPRGRRHGHLVHN